MHLVLNYAAQIIVFRSSYSRRAAITYDYPANRESRCQNIEKDPSPQLWTTLQVDPVCCFKLKMTFKRWLSRLKCALRVSTFWTWSASKRWFFLPYRLVSNSRFFWFCLFDLDLKEYSKQAFSPLSSEQSPLCTPVWCLFAASPKDAKPIFVWPRLFRWEVLLSARALLLVAFFSRAFWGTCACELGDWTKHRQRTSRGGAGLR